MKPYIPKQAKQSKDRLEVKLDRPLIEQLEAYCQYLESDRDYVISQLLQIAFRKDRAFAEWRRAHTGSSSGKIADSKTSKAAGSAV